jgi:hypothetical protein
MLPVPNCFHGIIFKLDLVGSSVYGVTKPTQHVKFEGYFTLWLLGQKDLVQTPLEKTR